jgi:starvation-inducible DNA-binding protein
MPPTATPEHLPSLGGDVRDQVGRELEATLIELIDLALWGKQLHWTVTGSLFRALHERLDELVDSWRQLADTVAERIVAVGCWPDGQAHTVAAGVERRAVDPGPVEDRTVLRLLTRRLAEASDRARTRMERLGELDTISQDVAIEVVRALEQQLWMSRAQLPSEAR